MWYILIFILASFRSQMIQNFFKIRDQRFLLFVTFIFSKPCFNFSASSLDILIKLFSFDKYIFLCSSVYAFEFVNFILTFLFKALFHSRHILRWKTLVWISRWKKKIHLTFVILDVTLVSWPNRTFFLRWYKYIRCTSLVWYKKRG